MNTSSVLWGNSYFGEIEEVQKKKIGKGAACLKKVRIETTNEERNLFQCEEFFVQGKERGLKEIVRLTKNESIGT